jgi:hypothetical protein
MSYEEVVMDRPVGVSSGGCLCGAVRYEVRGQLTAPHVCHCSQCRKQSGHCVAAAGARRSDFSLLSQSTLKWYRSSRMARRGFCCECGSVLLWDDDGDEISINLGGLDQPTGVKVEKHIFVDDKADYYEIDDDLEKFIGSDTPA